MGRGDRLAKPHQELIAKEGWVFLLPLVLLTLVSLLLRWPALLTLVCALLAIFVGYFFRNPYRQIPEDPGGVVSPADRRLEISRPQPVAGDRSRARHHEPGKRARVEEDGDHRLEDGRQLVSIFLNIFNVHVNRCPIGGQIERVQHTPGKFMAAYRPDASQVNERNAVSIRDGEFGVEVIQIAGLIARRIVCWGKEKEPVAKGQRFGLIRFGSRVDVVLPDSCEILVKPGHKVRGGADLIARRG